ncbi:MAG: hypothetical protein EA426_00915 [Spirochaetaceae bacterium]|nr:MAG: hypothetical protein EA426_00915 [Spirochaetaceae bacterium]
MSAGEYTHGVTITLALVQTHPRFLALEKNHAHAVELIDSTDADVYVLPELYLNGYAFSNLDELARTALPAENRYFDELLAISMEKGIAICGGYAESARGDAGPTFFNSAFLIADGELLVNYRKTHLFFRETQFFTAGDTGFSVVEWRDVRLGVMICFDWFYPEAARALALAGADVILHPSNLVLPYCQKAMYARAVENRVFIATVNRVGRETNTHGDDLTFTGASQLVSPSGEYLVTLPIDSEEVRTVEIDPTVARSKQINEFNDLLAGRRPEFYR